MESAKSWSQMCLKWSRLDTLVNAFQIQCASHSHISFEYPEKGLHTKLHSNLWASIHIFDSYEQILLLISHAFEFGMKLPKYAQMFRCHVLPYTSGNDLHNDVVLFCKFPGGKWETFSEIRTEVQQAWVVHIPYL